MARHLSLPSADGAARVSGVWGWNSDIVLGSQVLPFFPSWIRGMQNCSPGQEWGNQFSVKAAHMLSEDVDSEIGSIWKQI